jgi:hypothetical protein
VDELFMRHYNFSPYNYVLNNPLRLIDPNGKQVDPNEQAGIYALNKELSPISKMAIDAHEKFVKACEKTGDEVSKELVRAAIVEATLLPLKALGVAVPTGAVIALEVTVGILVLPEDAGDVKGQKQLEEENKRREDKKDAEYNEQTKKVENNVFGNKERQDPNN